MHSLAGATINSLVDTFLQEHPQRLFIGGQWIPSKKEQTFRAVDPATGAALSTAYAGGEEDIDSAVQAARTAFERGAWPRMTMIERTVTLHRLADLIEDLREVLAEIESMDVGKPLTQSHWDVANFSATLRYYADLAIHSPLRETIPVARHEAYTARYPYGVCAFILPWNFPFLLAGWNLAPALAAGNTVVLKPAEDASLSTLYLTRLIKEAGIPDGVVNVVPGLGEQAGAALARHRGIDHMAFTGSPQVGRFVAATCGQNLVPVKLELGGKGAAVVFDDVHVPSTVEALVRVLTLNAGQVCCTATRWLIHERIYDDFVLSAKAQLTRVRLGYWKNPETEMGPLISEKQRDRVLGYISNGLREGAEVMVPGGLGEVPRYPRGFWVKPALLAGPSENIACREEIFGPVAYLLKFHTEEEAVKLVNRSAYGLANSVWTRDLSRAKRVAEAMVAGNSWINAHNVFAHGIPYSGIRQSGLGGGVLGEATLADYFRVQSVVRPLEP